MNENRKETHPTPSPQSAGGVKYLATVGVLLVIIIAMLAVLWVRERRGRIAAEVAAARAETALNGLKEILGGVLTATERGPARPVQRDDLPSREADLDGRRRTLLELGASAGRRLGFRPGDLILVGEDSPSTQPGDEVR